MVDVTTIPREHLLERCLAQEEYIAAIDRFFAAKILTAEEEVIQIVDSDLAAIAMAKVRFNERLEALTTKGE